MTRRGRLAVYSPSACRRATADLRCHLHKRKFHEEEIEASVLRTTRRAPGMCASGSAGWRGDARNPRVGRGAHEGAVDAPIGRRGQLRLAPITCSVACLHIHAVLRVMIHECECEVVHADESMEREAERGTLQQPPSHSHGCHVHWQKELPHTQFLPAFEQLYRVGDEIGVHAKAEDERVEIRRDVALEEASGHCRVGHEKRVGALKVVVPRRVRVHVMLQVVLTIPRLGRKADRVQRQERPAPLLVLGLVHPVVAKCAEDGTGPSRG
eukprot:scaffold173690_cov37-Tisochrysis_lutea.AAC.1